MIISNVKPQVRQKQNFGLHVSVVPDLANNATALKAKNILSDMAKDVNSAISIQRVEKNGDLLCFMTPPALLKQKANPNLNITSYTEKAALERAELKIKPDTLTDPQKKEKFERETLKGYIKYIESFIPRKPENTRFQNQTSVSSNLVYQA